MAVPRESRQESMNHPSAGRTGLLRVTVLLLSFVIALIAFEITLRFTHDTPWYEGLVEEQARNRVQRFLVGGTKFKVRRPLVETVPTASAAYRILFLGDSFTYGSGIPDEDLLFPTRVTRALQKRQGENSSEKTFAFYNGGIPGSLTRRWVTLYREGVDLLNPNLVVVVFFLRDGTPQLGSISGLAGIRDALKRYREESFLFDHSHLYRLLVEQQKQREFGRAYFGSMKAAYMGSPAETREWQRAQKNLLAIRDDTQKRGARFVLVIFPVLFELGDDYPLQAVVDEIERFGVSNHIPTLSLLPAFRGEDASALWVSPLDQHPNARGHAIAAEAITEFLAERLPEPEDAGTESSTATSP